MPVHINYGCRHIYACTYINRFNSKRWGNLNNEEWKDLQKRKMMYANVNPETGEIESLTIPHKPIKSNLGEGWVAMFQDALGWLADANLPNEQYRVAMKLISKLDYDNYLRVTQTDIANDLGMKQSNVAKAIKELLNIDFIRKGPKVGNANTYRLNPYYGHKGQAINKTKQEYKHLKRIK